MKKSAAKCNDSEEVIYITHSPSEYSKFIIIDGKVSSAERISYVEFSHFKKAVSNEKYINRFPLQDFIYPDYYNETIIVLNEFNNPQTVTTPWELVYHNVEKLGITHKQSVTDYFYNKNQKLIETKQSFYVIYDEFADNIMYPVRTDCVLITKYYYDESERIVRKESYNEGEEFRTGISIKEFIYDDNGSIARTITYNSLDTSTKYYFEHGENNNKLDFSKSDTTFWNGKFKYANANNIIGETLTKGICYLNCSNANEKNGVQRIFKDGLITEIKGGNNIIRYEYDENERLLSISLNGFEKYITYSYEEISEDDNINVTDKKASLNDNCIAREKITVILNNSVSYHTKKDSRDNIIEFTISSGSKAKTIHKTYNNRNNLTFLNDSVSEKTTCIYNYETGALLATHTTKHNDNSFICESFEYTNKGSPYERYVGLNCYSYQFMGYINNQRLYHMTYNRTLRCMPLYDANKRITGKCISNVRGPKITEEHISYLKIDGKSTALPHIIEYADNSGGTYDIRNAIKYNYDASGNIREVYENDILYVSYEYDSYNRLRRENNALSLSSTIYSYDDNGNILAKHIYNYTTIPTDELFKTSACNVISYSYGDHSDRLLEYHETLFEYDSIGNPTLYKGKNLKWEFGRELVMYDGNTFAYDARGRRISKNNMHFEYDYAGRLVKQYNKTTTNSKASEVLEFMYDHTGLFAFKFDNSTYFYRKNAQNDIISILDSVGDVIVKYSYNAWGWCEETFIAEGADAIANLNPFRYRSYYLDTETNLYFLKTRYYDPDVGRFISIDDTIFLRPGLLSELNLYAYCENNPVMKVNPSGNLNKYYNKD